MVRLLQVPKSHVVLKERLVSWFCWWLGKGGCSLEWARLRRAWYEPILLLFLSLNLLYCSRPLTVQRNFIDYNNPRGIWGEKRFRPRTELFLSLNKTVLLWSIREQWEWPVLYLKCQKGILKHLGRIWNKNFLEYFCLLLIVRVWK